MTPGRSVCGLAGLAAAGLLISVLTGVLHAQARQRITQPVDNQTLIRLPGTTHPLATEANDRGSKAAPSRRPRWNSFWRNSRTLLRLTTANG